MVGGSGDVCFQNKRRVVVREKGREFSGKTRPSPSFDRVARQQSTTDREDTCMV